MRILMLSDFYPPHIGGLEQHVHTLSHELARRGHHVGVVTTLQTGYLNYEIDDGVPVFRLAGWNRALMPLYIERDTVGHPPLPDPGIMAGLWKVIRQERPDIIHAHALIRLSLAGLNALTRPKSLSQAKLVATLHGACMVCPADNFLYYGKKICTGPKYMKCLQCTSSQRGWAKAALLTNGLKLSSPLNRYVDRYVAVSSWVRDISASAARTLPHPMEVVPGFISDSAVDAGIRADRPAFLPNNDGYLLFVGRYSVHNKKGLDVLLEAYTGMEDAVPLVAIIAGDAPSDLPDGVTVVRNVPHDQVMAAWSHCSIGVVPSVLPESFGLVAVEAMSCGKPVVASGIGGLQDIVIDGETGLLVPPGDAASLREALITLLTDPARRTQMGAAGRHRARLFTASAVGDQIEQIYAEVLGERNLSVDTESDNAHAKSGASSAASTDETVISGEIV